MQHSGTPHSLPGVSLDACFVAGNTNPLPLLPAPFSFSFSRLFSFFSFPFLSCLGVPGCFRHSWEPFSSSLGVSLNACVVAGNTVFSILFLFFFPLFSPYPSLPRVQRVYKLTTGSSMRFGCSSVGPLSFGSLFIAPHRLPFFLFLHVLSVFMSCHPHPYLLLRAHRSDSLVRLYAHLHPLQTQASGRPGLTMKWGSLFVPVHLAPLHRNHVLSCPVLSPFHVFIFLSLPCAHMHISPCLSSSGLPLWEACVCIALGVTGIPLDFIGFALLCLD